jgi:hypothetical protein
MNIANAWCNVRRSRFLDDDDVIIDCVLELYVGDSSTTTIIAFSTSSYHSYHDRCAYDLSWSFVGTSIIYRHLRHHHRIAFYRCDSQTKCLKSCDWTWVLSSCGKDDGMPATKPASIIVAVAVSVLV